MDGHRRRIDAAVSVVMDEFVARKDAVADRAIDDSGLDMEDDEDVTVAVVLRVDVDATTSVGRLQMKRVCGKPGMWRRPYFQCDDGRGSFEEGYLDGYDDAVVRAKLTDMFRTIVDPERARVYVSAVLVFGDEDMYPDHPRHDVVAKVMQALALTDD